MGTARSRLLQSSCTLGQGFLPRTTEYTGATVVKGDTLNPGTAVTYGAHQDGLMEWQGEEPFDESSTTWTSSKAKKEQDESP